MISLGYAKVDHSSVGFDLIYRKATVWDKERFPVENASKTETSNKNMKKSKTKKKKSKVHDLKPSKDAKAGINWGDGRHASPQRGGAGGAGKLTIHWGD